MDPFQKRRSGGNGATGRKSETRTARRLGGRQQPGSGNMVGCKGDIVAREFLVEAKSTIAASLGIPLNWLIKCQHEADVEKKLPALSITFTTGNGQPVPDGSWVMVPERVFKRLMEENDDA